MKILVINGPNLNFLGIREKGIYGTMDYAGLVKMIEDKGKETGNTRFNGARCTVRCKRITY